jgi:hypothetical protein
MCAATKINPFFEPAGTNMSEKYRNKRGFKGILQQKIKKVATPSKIQIQILPKMDLCK